METSTHGPLAAMLSRYSERRGVSVRELARRTGRSSSAVARLFTGEVIGLKPWDGDSLLFLVARELEIPDREVSRAISAHYRALGEASLEAASARSTRKTRAHNRRKMLTPAHLRIRPHTPLPGSVYRTEGALALNE